MFTVMLGDNFARSMESSTFGCDKRQGGPRVKVSRVLDTSIKACTTLTVTSQSNRKSLVD